MDEKTMLQDGTQVDFYTHLTRNGIIVAVNTKLTPEQKEEFEKALKSERDVVSIRYN